MTDIKETKQRVLNAVNPRWWIGKSASLAAKREAHHVLSLLQGIKNENYVDTAAWQETKLLSILGHAYRHSPYYTDLFNSAGINPGKLSDFYNIPFLDKKTAKRRHADIVANNIHLINHEMKQTGGTSTEPLRFPLSELAAEMDSVHFQFSYEIMGYTPGDQIAAFGGVVIPDELIADNIFWIDVPGNIDLPHGRRYYSAFWVNKETLPIMVEHLLNNRPAILRGYPSAINEFASYILDNHIDIPFTVKGVQFTAENITPIHVQKAEDAFHTKVFFQYGHTEMGVFAYTIDDARIYYCSPFFGITEILDENGTHVAEGEVGEVVVTGFHNTAFPFIRYRTGDMAAYRGKENGFVMLEKMEGRIGDFIYCGDGRRISILAIPNLDAFKHVYRWQAIQNTPGKIVVRLVKELGYNDQDEKEIIECFVKLFDIHAQIEYVDSISLTQRGKNKLLIQSIEV